MDVAYANDFRFSVCIMMHDVTDCTPQGDTT